jgi:hypothetical protein
VPHSQCSLRENNKFLQNFRPKNNTLRENFNQCSDLISDIMVQAWHSKAKTIKLLLKIGCISSEKISKTCLKNASELCERGTSTGL